MDWDQYFITMCYLVAMKSKDHRTWVGAVIVGPDNEIRSTGYNSLPRGMDDSVADRYVRPLKDIFFEHAERNAIYNAARMGIDLKGCRLYINYLPCTDCMRGVIQSGISEVIVHSRYPGNLSTEGAIVDYGADHTHVMSKETGVPIRFWDGEVVELKGMCRGEAFDPTLLPPSTV